MRWRGPVACGLLLLMANPAHALCSGTSQRTYDECRRSCNSTCVVQTAQLGCDVEVTFPSASSRGAFPPMKFAAALGFKYACDKPLFCKQLLDRLVTSDPNCCTKACPGGFPRAECSTACAPKVMIFYAGCGDVYNMSHPLGKPMREAEQMCYKGLVSVAAKSAYERISVMFDVPFALWVMAGVPIFFFLFLAFFGRMVSTMFRVITGFLATCLPLLFPALVPYINACSYEVNMQSMETGCNQMPDFTALVFVQLFMSVYVGFLGAYASKHNATFGNIVQGFLLSYILVVQTADIWLGYVNDDPELVKYLAWISLGAIAAGGVTLGLLNGVFPDVLNILASTMIGIFMSMQIFCFIGVFSNWFFTFEVSALAMVLGVSGCTQWDCWAFLAFWVLLGLGCVYWQLRMHDIANIHAREEISWLDVKLYRIHHAFELLMQLNNAMEEEAAYHSPEELTEIAKHNARIYTKIATGVFDLLLLVFSASVFIGAAEMAIAGTFASGKMQLFGLLLFVNATITVLITCYEINIHRHPPDTLLSVEGKVEAREQRRKSFDTFMWMVMIMAPITIAMAAICWGTALPSDPLGTHALLDPRGAEEGLRWRDGELDTMFSYLKVIGIGLTGMATMQLLSAHKVANNLGGTFYLCMSVAKLVALLITGYGIFIGAVGYYMHDQHKDEPGVKLYIWLMAVGGLKFLSGIPGVLAARKVWDPDKVGAAQSWYKKFTVGLVLCGLVNGGIFLAAGLYVNKIDENIDADWADINATLNTFGSEKFVSKQEFVDRAKDGHRLLMVIGAITTGMLVTGAICATFIWTRSEEILTQAEKILKRHANEYLDSEEAAEKRRKEGETDYFERLRLIEEKLKNRNKKQKPDETDHAELGFSNPASEAATPLQAAAEPAASPAPEPAASDFENMDT